MSHIHNIINVHLMQPAVVTIGVFDGVHRGHQYLIRRLVQEARQHDRLSVVLTFFPHPDVVLRSLEGRYYLMSPEARAEEILKLGVDMVVTHPFNDQVRQIRASEFVNLLISHLHMRELWVGKDFALGHKREGDIKFLRQYGFTHGYDVQAIELVQADDVHAIISSTMIRESLELGEVEQAAEWMGRPHSMSGEVVRGDQRGRTIGFPTANIAVWPEQVIPAKGVYAGWATLGSERFMAATNVGVRPTFDGAGTLTVESYLLDFDRDIYGKSLTVTFDRRLRGEQKFNGIDELIAQIRHDTEQTRALLSVDPTA